MVRVSKSYLGLKEGPGERRGIGRLLEERMPKRICRSVYGGASTAFFTDTTPIPGPARNVLEL